MVVPIADFGLRCGVSNTRSWPSVGVSVVTFFRGYIEGSHPLVRALRASDSASLRRCIRATTARDDDSPRRWRGCVQLALSGPSGRDGSSSSGSGSVLSRSEPSGPRRRLIVRLGVGRAGLGRGQALGRADARPRIPRIPRPRGRRSRIGGRRGRRARTCRGRRSRRGRRCRRSDSATASRSASTRGRSAWTGTTARWSARWSSASRWSARRSAPAPGRTRSPGTGLVAACSSASGVSPAASGCSGSSRRRTAPRPR